MILTYLSQKVVEGHTHESKDQRLEGKEHQRFEGASSLSDGLRRIHAVHGWF